MPSLAAAPKKFPFCALDENAWMGSGGLSITEAQLWEAARHARIVFGARQARQVSQEGDLASIACVRREEEVELRVEPA